LLASATRPLSATGKRSLPVSARVLYL